MDALVDSGDEGRGKLAKMLGEAQTGFDPRISEWENPPRFMPRYCLMP